MNSSKYRFTLDMHTAQSQVSLPVVLNDTARKFYISLADGGKIYHIADGCVAVVRIERPTGTYIEHFCPIEDNTSIVYDFAEKANTAIVAGLHECEVTLYGLDGEVLTTARFSMVVSERVVNSDNVEITDKNWTVIDSIAAEEARRQDRFNQAMEDVEEAIDGIDDTINEIVPPYVGENGNWFVNGKDTGTQAQGDPGVYVGSGEMPEGYDIQIDPEGDEVFNPVLSVNGVEPDEHGDVTIKVGVDSEKLSAAVESALAEAKASGMFDGKDGEDGENGENGKDGTSVTITDIKESSVDGGTNTVTFSDGNKLNIKNGSAGSPGTGGGGGIDADQLNAAVEEALQNAKDSGEFGGYDGKSVIAYGAKGDGSTDDTAAFRAALAENRVVVVPEGTYILSDTLLVEENCCLELSQATVLKFTQTNKNCISLLRLASLKGNHATIVVPYTFSANVINCDTGDDEANLIEGDKADANNVAVPPFTKWDPQWKMSRYVTDINICKPDSRGFYYSKNGDCYGTALYIHCNIEDYTSYMWGVSMSGIRIAGGFNYGIRIHNIGDTKDCWNHDMRIEAVIDACKIGVSVENCRYARLAVTVQPRRAYSDSEVYKVYAEHGIELIDSRGVDLSSSRVWDWNEDRTLWSAGGKYQHLSLIGECMGLILDDYLYYSQSSSDIRELIYTDKPSNLEKMTILQEPFTRWFKPVNGIPYFYDGVNEKMLITDSDLANYFDVDVIKDFEDVLATAIDTDGSIYNGVGYKMNRRVEVNGVEVDSGYYGLTGYIPCVKGDAIYASGLSFAAGDDNCRIAFYDKDFQPIYYTGGDSKEYRLHINRGTLLDGGGAYIGTHEATDDGFKIVVGTGAPHNTTAYMRLIIYKNQWGKYPMVSINKPIKYTVDGFLADGIKIKYESIVGATAPVAETPVKGIDYYTEADKAEMVDLVLAALPEWNGGSY